MNYKYWSYIYKLMNERYLFNIKTRCLMFQQQQQQHNWKILNIFYLKKNKINNKMHN